MSVSRCSEKFTIVSNDHGRTQNSNFSVFYPFWANLVKKIKVFSLTSNLVIKLIPICRFQWWCSLFLFITRNILFGQLVPRIQKCLFKVKFAYAELIVDVHIFAFRLEISFLGRLGTKNQNCPCKLEFGS